jgi:pyruvate,water dikinase
MPDLVLGFNEIGNADVAKVGGKNASLGEMYNKLSSKGIRVPNGFATTSSAFWLFVDANNIREKLVGLMSKLDTDKYSNLKQIGLEARKLFLEAIMSAELKDAVTKAYKDLCGENYFEVAVRSSATAEDLPQASFAGQHESYLNIKGNEQLLDAVQRCYASLFTDRAIKYRIDNGFDYRKIALSVGVQKMVRSDKACSGVAFTLEPESGFRNIVHISGVWGLGENIVQGTVTPDEFYLFKPSLRKGRRAIVQRRLGDKARTMIYATEGDQPTVNIETPPEKKKKFVLDDNEVTTLANWALLIEEHYNGPMDIEWAKDGITNELFILQARPETVHSRLDPLRINEYKLLQKGTVLVSGDAIGGKIATGIVRVLHSPADSGKLKPGDIVVTELTTPDWDPILKTAAAIITDKGGRTSHASIVARELGVPAIVGTETGTTKLKDGQSVTVSCAEGKTGFVYDGELKFEESSIDLRNVRLPEKTHAMMILGDPAKAFKLSFYPNHGVGLMRMEFIINHAVQVHPMALVKFNELKDPAIKEKIEELTGNSSDKGKYFIDRLAEGIATIAAAFYPKEVIVRMSDFKTNEYANLLGGKDFEPVEENPMIGFRGASRYYNPLYKKGFRLECEAIKVVRNEMGLDNVKLMIPFCRTVDEGRKVIGVMKEYGLEQGVNGLEIYVMAEIPSNVIQAEDFAEIFDGFSIGSNDLTQLTLGIDRDSAIISDLFSEQNKSAMTMIAMVISKAKKAGSKIGLCGQAPSDIPSFAAFLISQGIDSISFNPDALVKGIKNMNAAEQNISTLSNSSR